ncbi:hypothetical protein GY45DRAFT_1033246 [Cubamyces sp. BRFM 1775]|nr:hypothetical protein GY45DRAFT_1033246 [Cubamyces sp. BRFM 1775]
MFLYPFMHALLPLAMWRDTPQITLQHLVYLVIEPARTTYSARHRRVHIFALIHIPPLLLPMPSRTRKSAELTLVELRHILSSSTGLHLKEVHPYCPDDFSVTRRVQHVEWGRLALTVIYGTQVSPVEAETITLVSRHTTVPVPRIHAVFTEQEPLQANGKTQGTDQVTQCVLPRRTVTYIVEERLPGRSLAAAWPTMRSAQRKIVVGELKAVFSQLAGIVPNRCTLGPLCGPWKNMYFHPFRDSFPCGDHDARVTHTFLAYFADIATTSPSDQDDESSSDDDDEDNPTSAWKTLDLRHFSMRHPSVFSHGELQPEKVLIHRGHIVGIVDWAKAGWYPYFWNSFVLSGSMPRFAYMREWEKIAPTLCPWYPEEAGRFLALWRAAYEAHGARD